MENIYIFKNVKNGVICFCKMNSSYVLVLLQVGAKLLSSDVSARHGLFGLACTIWFLSALSVAGMVILVFNLLTYLTSLFCIYILIMGSKYNFLSFRQCGYTHHSQNSGKLWPKSDPDV